MRSKPIEIDPALTSEIVRQRKAESLIGNIAMTLITLVCLVVLLGVVGEMEMQDLQQATDATSNAPHIAALDAAERRALEMVLATYGNEMPIGEEK